MKILIAMIFTLCFQTAWAGTQPYISEIGLYAAYCPRSWVEADGRASPGAVTRATPSSRLLRNRPTGAPRCAGCVQRLLDGCELAGEESLEFLLCSVQLRRGESE